MVNAFTYWFIINLLSSCYIKVSILEVTVTQKFFKIVTAFQRLIGKDRKMRTEITIIECNLWMKAMKWQCATRVQKRERSFQQGNNNVREETPSELTQNRWDLHNVKQAEGFPWQENKVSVKDARGNAKWFTWNGTNGSYKTAETDKVEGVAGDR